MAAVLLLQKHLTLSKVILSDVFPAFFGFGSCGCCRLRFLSNSPFIPLPSLCPFHLIEDVAPTFNTALDGSFKQEVLLKNIPGLCRVMPLMWIIISKILC